MKGQQPAHPIAIVDAKSGAAIEPTCVVAAIWTKVGMWLFMKVK